MNWFKLNQAIISPFKRQDFHGLASIGHESMYGTIEHTEQVWAWENGVIEAYPARDKETGNWKNHHSFWVNPSLYYRGRYDNKDSNKKVSVSVPARLYNIGQFELPRILIKALESEFGSDITIYPMSG